MKKITKTPAVLSIALGLSLGMSMPLGAAPQYGDHYGHPGDRYGDRYGSIRQLVDRTQNDLQAAAELERGHGDARSRYENAQRHLSTFDRHLIKGHFDKGEMDSAISDVQHILDKNTLQPSGRDALYRDIQDLRVARDRSY